MQIQQLNCSVIIAATVAVLALCICTAAQAQNATHNSVTCTIAELQEGNNWINAALNGANPVSGGFSVRADNAFCDGGRVTNNPWHASIPAFNTHTVLIGQTSPGDNTNGLGVAIDAGTGTSGLCVNGTSQPAETVIALAASTTHIIKYNVDSGNVSWTFSVTIDANNNIEDSADIVFIKDSLAEADCSSTVAASSSTGTLNDQQSAVASFVLRRQRNMNNSSPDIGGFIDGTFANGGGDLGSFALNLNGAGFNLTFASSLGRIWNSRSKNEMLATRQIAQDRSNNELTARSQTSAFLYGQSVPGDAPRLTQTSATTLKPRGDGDAVSLELKAEEEVYGSTAGALEVENTSQLAQARERGYDMWVQVYGTKAHAGDSDSTLWVGYAGGHKFVNDNLIIGGLVQVDWADESNDVTGSSADGFGWMVGPYIAAKIPDQNLFFDARAAYGRSDNDITLTTSTGSFQTERWLVSAKVSGLLEQDDIEIRPTVGVSYFEETQESYTDSTNTVIGSQTFTQGEIRFGPNFAKTYYQSDGTTLKPRIGINGVWNFSVDNGASTTTVLDNGDLRARLDIGLTILGTEKWFVDLSGFYDGIGINNYYAYGGKARLTLPLN